MSAPRRDQQNHDLADLFERGYRPAAIRYLLLSAHYRKELNFTFDGLSDAKSAIQRVLDFQDRLTNAKVAEDARATDLANQSSNALKNFEAALDDDLNTPAALGALFTFVREGNASLDRQMHMLKSDVDAAAHAIERMDAVLGIVTLGRAGREVNSEFAEWVESKMTDRQAAKAQRDFKQADAIRAELMEAGVIVEDTAQGPRWKKA